MLRVTSASGLITRLCAVPFIIGCAYAQGTISTVAGNGTAGYGGDGGAAPSAQLNYAANLSVDAAGNILISDHFNSRIRKVTPGGVITTVVGTGVSGYNGDGGNATAAQIGSPNGIAFDSAGNLYVADQSNQRIRKVTPGGIISTVAGNGTAGFSGDGGNATSAQLNNPYGVAVDSNGNLYIADYSNFRVRRVTPGGIISTVAGNGTPGFSGDDGSAVYARLSFPTSLAIGSGNNVYVADSGNNRIRMFVPDGVIKTVAGNGSGSFSGDGGSATAAAINNPQGVSVDGAANIFIGDTGNHRVRMVTPGGIITTIAGTGVAGFNGDGISATSAQLNFPSCATLDLSGNLLICDLTNQKIRRVTASGTPQLGSIVPQGLSGSVQTFLVTASHTGNAVNIKTLYVMFNSVLNGPNSCWAVVNPASGTATLVNDAATDVLPGTISAGTGSVSNSQCTITGSGFSVSRSGTGLSVMLPVSFAPSFSGTKNIYELVGDYSLQSVGWSTIGTWTSGTSGSPQTGSVNPASGGGTSQTFTVTASHTNGFNAVSSILLLFNGVLNGPNSCWVYVYPQSNSAKLVNDPATAQLPGVVTPGSGSVSNSQCTLSGNGFSLSKVGNTVTVNLPITFAGSFTGTKNSYELVVDNLNQTVGWNQIGTWTLGAGGTPQIGTMSPASGQGSGRTFTYTATHTAGAANVSAILVLIGNVLNGPNSCWVMVYPQTNTAALVNDAATGTVPGTISAGSGNVSNSQCSISGTGFSIIKSGNAVTVAVPTYFASSFSGMKNVYELVIDGAGTVANWTKFGMWIVGSPGGVPSVGSVSPAAGSGSSQAFTVTANHSGASTDINAVLVLISSVLNGPNSCWVMVHPLDGTVDLVNDAATGPVGTLVPGSGTVSNSQCTLSGSGLAISNSSNPVTVTLPITFAPSFTGTKKIYEYVSDISSQVADWTQIGTFTRP